MKDYVRVLMMVGKMVADWAFGKVVARVLKMAMIVVAVMVAMMALKMASAKA